MFRILSLLTCVAICGIGSTKSIAMETGTFYCFTDHMVGIQSKDVGDGYYSTTEYTSGRIKPSSQKAKFFVKITAWKEMDDSEKQRVPTWSLRIDRSVLDACTYVAEVAGIFELTRTLIEPGKDNILLNSILPGMGTNTDGTITERCGTLGFRGFNGEYFRLEARQFIAS